MSHFTNAHNFRIDSLVNNFNTSKSALERLESCITPGAIHNSDERSDAPSCMPETRVAVQNDINSWVEGDVEDQKMMWLSGPAGSGKTAIAGTVAERCNQRGTLAASFFFSSFSPSVDRSSKKGFVATLAYQLRQHPQMASACEGMLAAIDKDPMILRKRLRDQMEELILRPIRQLGGGGAEGTLATGAHPRVIIVDGLDECLSTRFLPTDPAEKAKVMGANQQDQREVLDILLAAANEPSFTLKILIVSRPERIIADFFATLAHNNTLRLFLDDKYDPDSDIRLFLTSSFSEIRRLYHIPASWPSQEEIETLVLRASGQFIYVTTVIRFIRGRSGTPQSQLDSVLSLDSSDPNTRAFADLDALYFHILVSTPNPQLSSTWIVLLAHSCTDFDSGQPLPAPFCRQFLETVPGEAEHLLGDLGSVIFTPPHGDQKLPYTLFHASLLDFLQDANRCPSQLSASIDAISERLYNEAFREILTRRGPKTHLAPEQLEKFIQNFLALYPASPVMLLIADRDVLWWTDKILSHCQNRSIVVKYLSCVHVYYARRNDNIVIPGRTRKVYRLWTRSISSACRQRGWQTPSRIEMLRRDVMAYFGQHWNLWDIEAQFVPPPIAGQDKTDIGQSEEGL